MKTRQTQTTNFEHFGIAALLPGLTYAAELLQRQLEELRATLEAIQNGHMPKRISRPPGSTAKGGNGGWPTDPEERHKEALRRLAVGRANKGLAPVKNPLAVAAGRKAWDSRTRKQQREHIARMQEGRRRQAAARRREQAAAARKGASRGGAASPNHPSNPKHPGHQAWVEKVSAITRRRFADKRAAA